VRDSVIREVIEAGVFDVDDIGAICGAGSKCGGCRSTLENLVQAASAGQPVLIGALTA
jgi:bacterioferritin-associated ferredoxin